MTDFTEALGLDVGEKRIGVARIGSVARLAEPVTTIDNTTNDVVEQVQGLVDEFTADIVVVGLPRNLSGEDTDQTMFSREFADTLIAAGMRVVLQDEALSSKKAENMIKQGIYKKNERGEPVGLDEVAACVFLEDFAGVNA